MQVESYEDGDRRIIKTTGICWGWKLSVTVYNPLYDVRLKSHHSYEQVAIPFNEHHKAVGSEEEWRWVCSACLLHTASGDSSSACQRLSHGRNLALYCVSAGNQETSRRQLIRSVLV